MIKMSRRIVAFLLSGVMLVGSMDAFSVSAAPKKQDAYGQQGILTLQEEDSTGDATTENQAGDVTTEDQAGDTTTESRPDATTQDRPTSTTTEVEPTTSTEENPVTTQEKPATTEAKPTKKDQTITTKVSELSERYIVGKKIDLSAKTSGNGKLTFSTSNSSVAQVTSTGIVTMKGKGICTITIKAAETKDYKSAEKTIEVIFYKAVSLSNLSTSYKRGKYYTNLKNVKLIGSTRDNILEIAKSQVGYRESSTRGDFRGVRTGHRNYTEYGRFYGMNGVAWCAIFVNWCARRAGVSYSVIPKYCAVRQYYSFFHRGGQKYYSWNLVRNGKYKLKKGDIIMYSNVRGGTTHHIGYVLSETISSKYITITTIEGNTDDAVRKVVMKMKRSNASGHVNKHYITGFGSPRY